jgi:hypothetical protein
MMEQKKARRPISLELAAAAQAAYVQEAKREKQEQGGEKANLSLQPGWGGKGR